MEYYSPEKILAKLKENHSIGLYYIRVKCESVIKDISPELYNDFIQRRDLAIQHPNHRVVYIGKGHGARGIHRRLEEELLHKGPGTFFRSLGAVMGMNPKRATSLSGIKNYRFDSPEKTQIIDFIFNHLEVSIQELRMEEITPKERNEIREYFPILNTDHNPFPSVTVKDARSRCRFYAGEYYLRK